MNIEETYTETVTRTRVLKTICDKCGNEIKQRPWSRNTLTVEYEYGSSYPEGGSGLGMEIEHLCHDCAKRMFDILAQNGYTIRKYEWDY